MGIEWLIYVIPAFAADLRGDTLIGIINHLTKDHLSNEKSQETKATINYSLPVTQLLAREDPNDAARRALFEHTGASVPNDPRSLTPLMTMYSHAPVIGDSYALAFVAHEHESKWPVDRMRKVSTLELPRPDNCPPHMRSLLARFCIYDTGLGARAFTNWPDAWRMLAQEMYRVDARKRSPGA